MEGIGLFGILGQDLAIDRVSLGQASGFMVL
jgi:hypothetical protein